MEEVRVAGYNGGRGRLEIATDPDAFERFYREHVEAVQRFVARRVDDPYLAADLTADVFVAAIESAARSLYGELARLSDAERVVFELVALDGLTVADTARALGINPVAARVRYHRARRSLRDHLALPTLEFNDLPDVS
jgi:DNA-directed RNA polymerase specialized sigma24 family protein